MLQTISDTKIRNAMRNSGVDASEEKIKAMIWSETDKEKRRLQHQFDIKVFMNSNIQLIKRRFR